MSASRTHEDHHAHAAMMDEVCKAIRGHFRDPGAREAHDARCAAALVIHYGGDLTAAMSAALPKLAEAA